MPSFGIVKAGYKGAKALGKGSAKRIVIGENMDRVGVAAKELGAETFTGKGMAANEKWIRSKIADGYDVYDIGPDYARRKLRGRKWK